MNMKRTTRRAILAGAASLPVAAIPAVAVPTASAHTVATLDGFDAELLALGAQLDQIIDEWTTRLAIDDRRCAAYSAACERVGLPRVEHGSIPRDEYEEYQNKRCAVWYEGKDEEAEETNELGESIVWKSINERADQLCLDIFSRKATTLAGLAVQVRAMTLFHSSLWDDEQDCDHYRECIEVISAFVGVTPVPLLAGTGSVA